MSDPEYQYYMDYNWNKIDPEDDSRPTEQEQALFNQISDEFDLIISEEETHEDRVAIVSYYSTAYGHLPFVFRYRDISSLKQLAVDEAQKEENYNQEIDCVEEEDSHELSDEEFLSTEELIETEGFFVSNGKPYSMLSEVPLGQIATYQSLLCGGRRGKRKKMKKGNRNFGGNRPLGLRGNNNLVKAGQLGLRNPVQMTRFPMKVMDEWRFSQIIESDGAGSFSTFCSLRNPTTALNGSGVYARAQEFAKLYDEYKVLDLVVILDFLNLNAINGFSRIVVDQDSIPSGTYTTGDVLDNEYMREFSGSNQISYVSKVIPLSEGTYRGTPSVIFQRGWYDFNTPPDEGAVIITGDRFPPGVRLANVTLTMRVLMRRRRNVNIAREHRIEEEQEQEKQLLQKMKKLTV